MSAPEEIESINQIIAIIDQKATLYKDELFDMPTARKNAEQKLILDLIDDALSLADSLEPKAIDIMQDLKKLQKDILRY